jgi:hypothetical protein
VPAQAPEGDQTVLVSRSGKAAGALLQPADWARVTRFDRGTWSACYESSAPDIRPSSDTPLLQSCLLGDQCKARYGWGQSPNIALHGHALAEGAGGFDGGRTPATGSFTQHAVSGRARPRRSCLAPRCDAPHALASPPAAAPHPPAGLAAAQQLGLPISDHETLFSTPEDLDALEALFLAFPYPQHRLYVRKGHGFFLLGQTCEEVQRVLEGVVAPIALQQLQQPAGQQ